MINDRKFNIKEAEKTKQYKSFTKMEESFTTFNHVDMSILKKEPLYNHLNLDSLAKRGQVKIKINENEDI